MREERLLERIRRLDQEPAVRSRFDPRRAVASVVEHLQRLLNTRQGSVAIAGDYGLPDLMYILQGGPAKAYEVENLLRDVIEKYEPRLATVQVRYAASEDGMHQMRFEIQARLKTDSQPFVFETRVGPDGHVDVVN